MKRKAQSSLEYVTIFSVIVAAILMGQSYMKRKVQSYIKSQGDTISSEDWSFSSSTERFVQKYNTDQKIIENTNTKGGFIAGAEQLPEGVYSKVTRTGGEATVERSTKTDSLNKEAYDVSEYPTTEFSDFQLSQQQ